MNKASPLLQYQSQGEVRPEIVEQHKHYKSMFTLQRQNSVTQGALYPLVIDFKEVFIEIPLDKQGIHPKFQHDNRVNRAKQFYTMFQQSGLVPDVNKQVWYYQDDKKTTFGPLSCKEMDGCLNKGLINFQTRVALESLDKFVRIEKIMKVIKQTTEQPIVNTKKVERVHTEPVEALQAIQPPQSTDKVKTPTPFRHCGLTKDYNANLWFYKYGVNEPKGPFSTVQMDQLWQQDKFNDESKIGFENTNKFVKFEKIVKLAQIGMQQEEKEAKEALAAAELKKKEGQAQFNFELDYTKVKQNVNLGEWGQPFKAAKPVQAVVTSTVVQKKKDEKPQIQNRKRNDNKSMHVEGNQGNLYQKRGYEKPGQEVIYEQKEDDHDKKVQELNQYMEKIYEKTNGNKQTQGQTQQKPQTKEQQPQVLKQVKAPAQEPVKAPFQAPVQAPVQVTEKPAQEASTKEVDEDDGWQTVSKGQNAKKRNTKQQQKNSNVQGFIADPNAKPHIVPAVVPAIVQKPKPEVKAPVQAPVQQQTNPVAAQVVVDEDDGWQEVTVKKAIKPKK